MTHEYKLYIQDSVFEEDLLASCFNIHYNANSDINKSMEQNIRDIYGEDLNITSIDGMINFLNSSGNTLRDQYPYMAYTYVNGEQTYSNKETLSPEDTSGYHFFIHIHFDENGNVSLENSYNFALPIKNAYYSLINSLLTFYDEETNVQQTIDLITNKDFYFALSEDCAIEDFLYATGYYYQVDYEVAYLSQQMDTILLSFVILFIITCFLPVKKFKTIGFYQKIFAIPVEILIVVSLMFLNFSASIITNNIFHHSADAIYLYTFLAILFIFDVMIAKDLLIEFNMNYLHKRSLCFKGIDYASRYLKSLDLSEHNYFTLAKFIIIGMILLIVLVFFLGMWGIIWYAIIAFIIAMLALNSVKRDYKKLLEVTSQIASGKFDTSLNSDLGIFNSYKNSMNAIRDDFKTAVDNAVKSEKMKTELITSVSHDLKTPLTSIVSYVDLLKDSTLTEDKKQEYINIIDHNASRLKNLINDLFEVSKASSGNIQLDFMEIDILSLIKQALLEYDHLFTQKGLQIKLTHDLDKYILTLDSQKTYRIFTNLFTNIYKYALENTRVYIDITTNENMVVVTLRNISKNEIHVTEEDLLERFVQGDQSRHSEGSGLGLAIVKTFCELQQATCHVHVDGDLFKVTLRFDTTFKPETVKVKEDIQ